MTEKAKEARKTTKREAKFAAHYALHLNGQKAAKFAGYSEKTAASAATRLLKKPQVMEAIDQALAKLCDEARLEAGDILGMLHRNYLLAIERMDIHAANRAAELLGQYRKMFGKTVDHNINDNLPDRLAQARERVRKERQESEVLQ